MRDRLVFTALLLGLVGATGAIGVAGCSSSSSPSGSGEHEGTDSGGHADTGTAADTGGGGSDGGGSDGGTADDASHDAPSPDALYGCAVTGSFGSTCNATTTGADPTECTDPNFPDCFVGGQGAWCTKTCSGTTDCTGVAEDAGCAPSSCNTKGYCK